MSTTALVWVPRAGAPEPVDPRLLRLKQMVLDAVTSANSKRNYAKALDDLFAVMPIFLFQRMKNLNTNNDWLQWVSFGVRPEVFLTKHLSLTGDCGFDHTHLFNSYDGWLRKCTFAPQIGADRKFFGRPVLRVFVTYANWSNGFRGLVGGVPFENQTAGLTYGVQTEHLW